MMSFILVSHFCRVLIEFTFNDGLDANVFARVLD